MRKPSVLTSVGIVVATVSLVAVGVFAVRTWRAAQAKQTVTHMLSLYQILASAQPSSVDPESVAQVLNDTGFPGRSVQDAWGHPFLIEIVPPPDDSSLYGYQIRALGRDGIEGPCCRGNVGNDWDADAVLRNGTWLQYW